MTNQYYIYPFTGTNQYIIPTPSAPYIEESDIQSNNMIYQTNDYYQSNIPQPYYIYPISSISNNSSSTHHIPLYTQTTIPISSSKTINHPSKSKPINNHLRKKYHDDNKICSCIII